MGNAFLFSLKHFPLKSELPNSILYSCLLKSEKYSVCSEVTDDSFCSLPIYLLPETLNNTNSSTCMNNASKIDCNL